MRTRSCVALLFAALAVAPAARAAPECRLRGRPWLEGRVRGAAKLGRVVEAKRGQTIDVYLVAPGLLNGRPVQFGETGGRGRVSWTASGCPAAAVSWRRVEPRMEHVSTPAPNRNIACYANAIVFGPSHGEWLGFDKIEYYETPITGASGWTISLHDARPTDAEVQSWRGEEHQDLGTMRLAATVAPPAAEAATTAGAEDAPSGQVSDRVFRYSFRARDGVVGWMTSWFNVPYLFGSAGKGKASQAERYVGADCADLIVGAIRRSGRPAMEYSSVNGLAGSLDHVAPPVVVRPACGETPERGCGPAEGERLPWGKVVRSGDVLVLDYIGADSALPKDWDHIVVLVEDRGPDGAPDGLLGPEDIVADSGSTVALKFAPLGEQGAVRVGVLRVRGAQP